MMPNPSLSRSAADSTPAGPLVRATIVPVKRTLQDLFTGGWMRPLDHMPTALR